MKHFTHIELPEWKRAVIKVGSALVAPEGKFLSNTYTLDIAGFITECRNRGKEMILVTSGAVAAGISRQPALAKRQLSMPEKQAMAAIGQPLLMAHWSKYFDFPCAQLLLTYQGINERQRFVNARNTILELLAQKTLPIVNENDTVVVDEIKVGDNDNLAAHVAALAEADILFICSDVDGLFDADPRINTGAHFIPQVNKITQAIYDLAGGRGSLYAIGGMVTKIQAAEKATARGITTVVFNGSRRLSYQYLLDGIVPGTLFCQNASPITAKKHWILHALKSKGIIYIDAGARKAVRDKGASLLPSGILSIEGRFKQGDAVTLQSGNQIIARGICQYDSGDLDKIKGKKSTEIESILGYFHRDEVIHRDDLVLM
ncbi:glutamate 5-kinase [candidate division KSB1 bacterium]|nr:glutamate 5-kinase [candidate division KSB1 bacterium]RQW03206.1 MAG: glutamate 5-kinase [candidate division KSB1 bacterium]